jgi:polyphosphate glucokinase
VSQLGLGVDIGGSGIKAAEVDLEAGRFSSERHRIPTPQPATPEPVIEVVAQLVSERQWGDRPVGITFPSVVLDGRTVTAANVDKSFVGFPLQDRLAERLGAPVRLLNDADAAGLAEMKFGAGREASGVVLLLTLGTGIGSALFVDGHLVPNTEFGHVVVGGHEAEKRASDSARSKHDLSWKQWAERLSEVISHLESLIWPDLVILGGGVSKKAEHFLPLVKGVRAELVAAQLKNDAGIIGAALAAQA